jgi:hypothetical protein
MPCHNQGLRTGTGFSQSTGNKQLIQTLAWHISRPVVIQARDEQFPLLARQSSPAAIQEVDYADRGVEDAGFAIDSAVIATAHELLTVDQPALAKGEAADRTDTR